MQALRQRTRYWLSVLVAAGLSSSVCWADTVHLKDGGSRLEGSVVSVTEHLVMLRTGNGSMMSIERAQVRSIVFSSSATVLNGLSKVSAELELEPLDNLPPQSLLPPPVPVLSQPHGSVQPGMVSGTYYTSAPLGSGSPVQGPNTSVQTASIHPISTAVPDQTLAFPSRYQPGGFNQDAFIPLSTFKGSRSGQLYAGIYNFEDKGTFWARFPEAKPVRKQIKFTLYGKLNKNQPIETFAIRARFLDAYGKPLEESRPSGFLVENAKSIEWFEHLEGISGIAGQVEVLWSVPPNTKTVEFLVSSNNTPRHLVGYLSDLLVLEP